MAAMSAEVESRILWALSNVQSLLTFAHALAIGRVILSIGKNKKSAIYILVDRKLLYTVIVKLNGKNATELADKTIKALEPISNKIFTTPKPLTTF